MFGYHSSMLLLCWPSVQDLAHTAMLVSLLVCSTGEPTVLYAAVHVCRIRQWTGDTQGWYKNKSNPVFNAPGQAYVFIYGMLTLAFLVLMLFRGHTFHMAGLGGAQKLHKKMFHK